MQRPEITVTMPAYNRAALIGRAIESVQAQTLPSWELIIVDDDSTDTTLEIARTYAASDARIEVLHNEHNLGIGPTRNRALAHARGRFITPLDSDDWYLPDRLERMLRSADEHNAQLLSDDLLIVREGDDRPATTLSEICAEPLVEPLRIDMAGLLRRLGVERDGIALGLTKPLIERQFLIDHAIAYDISLPVGEDYWILADCVAAGARFVMIPEALYNYRLHAQQTTKSTDPANDVQSTRRRLAEFLGSDAATNDVAAAMTARYHLGRMDVLTAYDSFAEALKSFRVDKAARHALREPKVVRELATRLPLALERRRRARRGDPFAYDQLFGPHLSRHVPEPTRNRDDRALAPVSRWRLGKRATREVAVS
ncbi:MAG: glycosyltransferase family 2 protein [Acidimicrobiales bacterium]